MLGENIKPLISLCNKCHRTIEFDDNGNKRRNDQANKKLKELTKNNN